MIDINRAEKQGLAAASKEALTSWRHPSTVQPLQPCQHNILTKASFRWRENTCLFVIARHSQSKAQH